MVGIRSTALLFGEHTKTWLHGFTTLSAAGWLTAGHAAGCAWPYDACVLAAAAHMAWQVHAVNLDDGPDCSAKFVSNKWVGAMLFAGAVSGRLLS